MAIIYRNPLRKVANPEIIKGWIKKARDPDVTFAERRGAIGRMRGAVIFYRKDSKGNRAVLTYLQKEIAKCQELLAEESKGGT